MPDIKPDKPDSLEPALTKDNMLEHSQTPPDMLHQHATGLIEQGAGQRYFRQVIAHPNTSTQTLKDIFQHQKSQADVDTDLFDHPNASPEDIADYVSINYGDYKANRILEDHPKINKEFAKDIYHKVINSPEDGISIPNPRKDIEPEFYHGLLKQHKELSQKSPETNDEIRQHGEVLYRLSDLGNRGLAEAKHTPDSLSVATDYFSSPGQGEESHFKNNVPDFIKNNPELTKEHLNKLWEHHTKLAANHPHKVTETLESIISHHNTDPALVAQMAHGVDHEKLNLDDEWAAGRISNAAVKSPSLPEETRKALVNKYGQEGSDVDDYALLENPNITPEEVVELHKKGSGQALYHEKMPPEQISAHWNSTEKKTEHARDILKTKNTPKDVLKEIVHHKNQDVAIEALNHHNADKEVVMTALARKAKKVQEAAALHPSIKAEVLDKQLKDGKIDPHKALFHEETRKYGSGKITLRNDITPEQYHIIGQQMDDMSAAAIEKHGGLDKYFQVKDHLLIDEKVPKEVQAQARKSFYDYFDNKLKKDVMPRSDYGASADNKTLEKVTSTLKTLAEDKNDPEAQKRILETPHLLSANLRDDFDFSKSTYDSQFLNKLSNKILEARGRQVEDRIDTISSGTIRQTHSQILKNPNCPENLFNKLVLDNTEDYHVYYNLNDPEHPEHSTILDKFFSKQPEEIKRYNYEKMATKGNDGQLSVLQSKQVPVDIWLKTFNQYPNLKQKIASQTNFANAPQEIQQMALDLSPEFHDRISNDTSAVILSNIIDTEKNKSKKALLLHNLTDKYIQEIESNRNGTFNDVIVTNAILKNITNVNSNDREAILDKLSDPKTYQGQYKSAKAIIQTLASNSKEANDAILRNIDINTPEGRDIAYRRIEEVLRSTNSTSKLKDLAQTDKTAYDWMYNISTEGLNLDTIGGENIATDVKTLLLGKNLLSPELKVKIQQERSQNLSPEDYATEFRNLNSYDRRSFIEKEMQSGNLNSEKASLLLKNIDLTDFSADRANVTPEELDRAKTFYAMGALHHLKTIDAFQARHINSNKLINATDDIANSRFPSKTKKELLNSIFDTVKNSPLIQPDVKQATNVGIISGLSGKDATKLLDKDFVKETANTALKEENIGQLSDLYNTFRSDALLNNINNLMTKKPELIKSYEAMKEVINTLETSVKKDNLTLTTKKFIKNTANYIFSENFKTDQPEYNNSFQIRAYNALRQSISDTDQKHNDYAVNLLINNRQNVFESVGDQNDVLATLINSNNLDRNNTLKVYKAFTSEFNSYVPQLGELINDPEFLAESTGNKLDAAIRSINSANSDTTKVIINRLVDDQSPNLNKTIQAKSIILNAKEATTEDLVKLARSVGTDYLIDALQNESDLDSSNVHQLFDLFKTELTDQTSKLDLNDLSSIKGNFKPFIGLISKYSLSESDKNYADKNTALNELKQHVIGKIGEVSDNLLSNINNNTSPDMLDSAISNSITTCKALHETLAIFLNSIDEKNKLTSEQGMAVFNNFEKIYDTELNLNKTHSHLFPIFHIDYKISNLKTMLNFSDFDEKHWPDLLDKAPYILDVYANHEMSAPQSLLKSIDVKKIVASDPVGTFSNITKVMQNSQNAGRNESFPKLFDALYTEFNNYRYEKTPLVPGMFSAMKLTADAAPNQIKTEVLKKLFDEAYKGDAENLPYFSSSVFRTGAGGQELVNYAIKSIKSSETHASKILYHLADSPFINAEAYDLMKPLLEDSTSNEVFTKLASNPYITPQMASDLENHVIGKADMNLLAINKNTSETFFNKQVDINFTRETLNLNEEKRSKEALIFTNPKLGGNVFRILKAMRSISGVKGFDSDKGYVQEFQYSKTKSQLNEVLPHIPPEGITWKDLKAKFPRADALEPVKNLFREKQNKPVSPDDILAAISEDKSGSFYITYDKHTGAQRHMEDKNANLVVQLNSNKHLEEHFQNNPKLHALYKCIQDSAMHSGHPTNLFTVSWIRIDTQDAKNWIVEEFQSDFSSQLKRDLDNVLKQAKSQLQEKLKIHVTPEEILDFGKQIEKLVGNWYEASMQGMEELAKKHGVENLYIHGKGVRAALSGYDEAKEMTVKVNKMHHKDPPKFGYEKCDYSEYPHYNKSMIDDLKSKEDEEFKDTSCWRKRLK